jgi:hypothetical protein
MPLPRDIVHLWQECGQANAASKQCPCTHTALCRYVLPLYTPHSGMQCLVCLMHRGPEGQWL